MRRFEVVGRAVEAGGRSVAGAAGNCRAEWRGQSVVPRCGVVGASYRSTVARSSGTIRRVKQCLSAVQSLGQEGRVAASLRRSARPRSGVGDARRHDRPRSRSRGGCSKKSGDQELGRSRGGFGTKIHAACDGLGHPVKFRLTPGQTHDITQAEPLLEGLAAEHVIADKGYDGNQVLETIHAHGGQAVIPPKSHRKVQRPYDRQLYRERNHIERLFTRLKQCRRIATRYDKTARNFLAFLHLAASMILLA